MWNLQIKDTLGQLHLFFVRRLSSLGVEKWTLSCVLRREIIVLCPYLGESIIGDSTVIMFALSVLNCDERGNDIACC